MLEVREFDEISCNKDYTTEYAYLPEPAFSELVRFIQEFDAKEETADILDFMKLRYRRGVGTIVSVNNYVGVIQLPGGYQIEILPKVEIEEESRYIQTKRVFLKMLRSLREFQNKKFNMSDISVDRLPLFEIFIRMYLQDVRTLVKHGIKSGYLEINENINYLKGKLLIQEHIKRNASHEERFYASFDDYQVNRPENRIIKSTLLKLQRESFSAENKKEAKQLLTYFELVEPSDNYAKDFSGIVLDRSTKEYEDIILWSRVFLTGKSFSSLSGNTNARSILFPMEKVFESYVAQQLKKELNDLDWNISTQDKGRYLFDEPRQFALRPDIVITRDDASKVVLDTKWKVLHDKPERNYGIAQADMYQMYAYAKKYGTSEIWLLFPLNKEMSEKNDIVFISNENHDDVSVRVFFVNLLHIDESMAELRNKLLRKCY